MMNRYGCLILGVALWMGGSLSADNSVSFLVEHKGRIELGVLQSSYKLECNVEVVAQTVEVKFPGAVAYIPLEFDEEDGDFDLDWIQDDAYPTLSQLFAAFGIVDGDCRIRIDKGLATESVYQFSMNLVPIVEEAFPGFAAVISPEEGQITGPEVTFSWINPDGSELFLGPWMGVEQEDLYHDSGMQPAGTTEWTCPPLNDGPATFDIGYAAIVEGVAGVMTHVSGLQIDWGLAEHSPDDWTPGRPLTALLSDLDIHFQVRSVPKAQISFGYIQRRMEDSSDYDTYNAVCHMIIPNASAVFLTIPSAPDAEQPLERISPDTYRLRLLFSSFQEMMAQVGPGTYHVHVYDKSDLQSMYQFEMDPSAVNLEPFPGFVDQVQPPRNSLIEIPGALTWELPEGYSGGVIAVVVKETDSPTYMLPPYTTSITLNDLNLEWNQLVFMTTRSIWTIAGPMTYVSGFEIDWDQTGTVPAGWPTDVPHTYLGSEWMGAYYAIEPGRCAFRLPGDLNDDCQVSLEDFALMAEYWLMDCRGTSVSVDCWGFL